MIVLFTFLFIKVNLENSESPLCLSASRPPSPPPLPPPQPPQQQQQQQQHHQQQQQQQQQQIKETPFTLQKPLKQDNC